MYKQFYSIPVFLFDSITKHVFFMSVEFKQLTKNMYQFQFILKLIANKRRNFCDAFASRTILMNFIRIFTV